MEHVTCVFNHDVIVVSVADPEQVGGDTVAGTGRREVFNGLRKIRDILIMAPIIKNDSKINLLRSGA